MKKMLLIVAAVLALATPLFAATENIDFGGAIEMRAQWWSPDNTPDYWFVQSEIYLWAAADLSDNVMAKIAFKYKDAWGDESGAPDYFGSTNGDVNLQEGWLKLAQIWDSPISAKFGRFELSKTVEGSINQVPYYGEGFFIPNNGPVDGITITWDMDPTCIDFMWWKISENNLNAEDDNTLWAAYLSTKAVENWIIDVYGGYGNINANYTASGFAIPPGTDYYNIGARAETNSIGVEGLGLKGEFDWASIDAQGNIDGSGFGAYFGGAYKFSGDAEPTIRANIYWLDEEFVQVLGHVDADDLGEKGYGAIADVNSALINNVWFINIGGSMKANDKVGFDADFYYYQQPEDTLVLTPTGPQNQDSLGYEIDLIMSYQYSENVAAELIGGWYSPDDKELSALVNGWGDDTFLLKGAIKVSF